MRWRIEKIHIFEISLFNCENGKRVGKNMKWKRQNIIKIRLISKYWGSHFDIYVWPLCMSIYAVKRFGRHFLSDKRTLHTHTLYTHTQCQYWIQHWIPFCENYKKKHKKWFFFRAQLNNCFRIYVQASRFVEALSRIYVPSVYAGL